MSDNRKTLILDALRTFVAQRPGFDTGNYDRAGYRADSRRVTQQRHDFERLAQSVETLDEITADDLMSAFPRAFSGRLTLVTKYRVEFQDGTRSPVMPEAEARDHWAKRAGKGERGDGTLTPVYSLEYCTGQYWCTEYRAAACAVLASALWDCQRKHLPAAFTDKGGLNDVPPENIETVERSGFTFETYGPRRLTAGEWLRDSFRHWYGRGIQSRWFN